MHAGDSVEGLAGLKPGLYKSAEEEQGGERKIPTLKKRGWGTRRDDS